MTHLRPYLVEHPALVWVLGFPPVPSPHFLWGFDAEASLSSARQFSRVLRTLDNAALQFLLDGTVSLIGHELPDDVDFADSSVFSTTEYGLSLPLRRAVSPG